MVEGLEEKYGKQEQDHRGALLAIQQEREKLNRVSLQNLLTRAWRHLNGRARLEEETASLHRAALSRIEFEKRGAALAFETDRRQRMELLKAENAAFERQEQAAFDALDPRRFDEKRIDSAREFEHAVRDWEPNDHHEPEIAKTTTLAQEANPLNLSDAARALRDQQQQGYAPTPLTAHEEPSAYDNRRAEYLRRVSGQRDYAPDYDRDPEHER